MAGFVILPIALLYFLVQSLTIRAVDRRTDARNNAARPLVYSLSLAASGSSWIYYGSTGYAAQYGIEFAGLYIGIVLAYTVGFRFLLRLVRLAKSEGITSISDFIGARYGKSFSVAALVTIIVTIGLIPYIALQMKAIRQLFDVFSGQFDPLASPAGSGTHLLALSVILGIGLFTVYHSARSSNVTERYDGLIHALAVDTIVKSVAFLFVGMACVTFLFGSPADVFGQLSKAGILLPALHQNVSLGNLAGLILIGASSVLFLPSQFYLTIVENRSDQELRTARWFIPISLLIVGVFVVPIAAMGSIFVPGRTSVDFYFLSLPLAADQYWLGAIAFIGGLPAATAMVIFPSILLSIMISNDLFLPLLLRRASTEADEKPKNFTRIIPNLRRVTVAGILLCAFAYQFLISTHVDFASLALISAVAIIQLLPPFLGGLAWRRGTARGAQWGMIAGFCVWAYTMVLPTLFDTAAPLLADGPFGWTILRPQALFGLDASNYVHGLFWSLSVNVVLFIAGSVSRSVTPLERIQASIFIADHSPSANIIGNLRPSVTVAQLKSIISKYIGSDQAELAFGGFHKQENIVLDDGDPADFKTVHFSEQLLSEIVGSPSARMLLSLAMGPTNMAQRQTRILLDHATGALAQNRHLLQTALDQMDQGIGVFDSQHRLSCWNVQFQLVLELPRELQRMGTPLDRILRGLFERGDLVELGEQRFTRDVNGPVTPLRLKLRRTGQTIEVRSNSMPDGGLVTTFTDISGAVEADDLLRRTNESLEQRGRDRTAELTLANQQLAKAQKRAEEANVEKTRFLADAGHDILQPLNAARLYSSALMARIGDLREKELAQNVDSSLEAVESIISALLDISRLDTGALKPVVSVFRLDPLLQQIVRDCLPGAREKGLELRLVASSAVVATDRNLLRRLIQNLVSNAIKYTRTGKVLIGIRRHGPAIELTVCDSGIGIAKHKIDYIFREFARLAEGVRESDGLGLGLSIVERIAKILDLQIKVRSSVGKGSVFSVVMPLSDMPSFSTGDIQPPAPSSNSLTGMRILCIDDNALSLSGMRELLDAWGCEVVPLMTGKEIRNYCLGSQAAPDVILADYDLDEDTGLDVIRFARDHYGRCIHAALITADRSDDVQQRAAAANVSMINKPVRPAILRALLSHFRQKAAE